MIWVIIFHVGKFILLDIKTHKISPVFFKQDASPGKIGTTGPDTFDLRTGQLDTGLERFDNFIIKIGFFVLDIHSSIIPTWNRFLGKMNNDLGVAS